MRVGGIGNVRLGGDYGGEQLEFFRPQLYLLGDKTGHVYSGLPRGAPRCGRPSLVIFTSVSPKRATAADSCSFLMTSQVLEALGW